MVDHVSPDISRCGLSIVSIKYKSDNYQRAVAKLKLLENQSSVSQTDEDDETENRKRQPKTRQLQDFVQHISSSDDEEIPVPPNVTIDTVVTNKPILNKSIKHLADLDTPQMSPAGSDSSVTISASVSSKHLPPQPQQTCYNCKVNENLLRELIQAVYEISRDVQYLTRLVQNSNIGDDTLQPSAELDVLPATSSEDLENLNRNLENADFLNALSTTLQSVGGKDVIDTTRRILARIVAHDVSLTYNWSGRNKNNFSKLKNVIKLVLVAVRKNPLSKSATQLEVEGVIKVWLRSAPDREGGRVKRSKPKCI
ncbi:hypothetical protein RN001_002413 [Aquatica leii]|uniref:DUF4806 domain-containing protein n=1 Tax=Aquatica leii TaxID=1421715 RepID=A0AAN7SK49_9COLE|nr:hypothetical protein RN001_002413 [Aquatica leii]